MAKKQVKPLEDPPIACATDDEEMETSGEEEEHESDSSSEENDEPKDQSGKKTPSAAPAKPAASADDSDSGSETETNSDSETEQQPSNPGSAKPVAVAAAAAKPTKNKEVRGSGAAPSSAAASASTALKRPSEGTSKAMKRAKTALTDDEKKTGEDPKKTYFQRLWSEEDEITVLQGMIDFKSDTGISPYENMNGFFDDVKESISFGPSKSQFVEKIRGLKKKYMSKGKNGVEPSFTKSHDKKCFGLAKYIWGSDGLALDSAIKSNIGKSKKSEKMKPDSLKLVEEEEEEDEEEEDEEEEDKEVSVLGGADSESLRVTSDWFENSFVVQSIVSYSVDEHYVKQQWRSVPMVDKKKLEANYKALRTKEVEYLLQKTRFINEAISMIFEASQD